MSVLHRTASIKMEMQTGESVAMDFMDFMAFALWVELESL